jgi:hypothetical protein
MVESLDPTITAATFYSACNTIITNITGVSFVDDTSLAATSEYQYDPALSSDQNQQEETRHMVHKLGRLGQHWERLLFTTGGAINLQKSHWYLMTWLWKNGIPHLASIQQALGDLSLTTGYNKHHEIVPRLQPSTSFRTLGVYIAPSGRQNKQAQILRQHSENYQSKVKKASFTSDEAYLSYMSYLRPRLIYPLPCSLLTQQQCRHIKAPALSAVLSKMHLNCPGNTFCRTALWGFINPRTLYGSKL